MAHDGIRRKILTTIKVANDADVFQMQKYFLMLNRHGDWVEVVCKVLQSPLHVTCKELLLFCFREKKNRELTCEK